MILDSIENSSLYLTISEHIGKGLKYIQDTDLINSKTGKYDLGDGILGIVSEYDTKPIADCRPEAHKKYIDIQYIIKGVEKIGYVSLSEQTPSIPYNEENDVVFYIEKTSLSIVPAGFFAIYFPTDIHQPCIMVDEPAPIKKLVIKIPV